MTIDPLGHELTQRPLGRGLERIEDEFVFTTVLNSPTQDEETNPVTHSIHIDPTDGQEDELVLEVTEMHGGEVRDQRSLRLSMTSSGVGDPPRVQEVEAALKRWYHRHYNPSAVEEPSSVERTA